MDTKEIKLSITKLTAIVTLIVTSVTLISSLYGFYSWMLSVGDERWAKIEIISTVYANTTKINLQELYRQRTASRTRIFDLMEMLKIQPDSVKYKAELDEVRKMLDGINEDIRRLEIEKQKPE